MSPRQIESLTPSERSVLRKLLEERDQKTVARALGLSPETVKSHLKNAREKCGAQDSFSVAKALAEYEGHPPRWGIPFGGGEPDGREAAMAVSIESIYGTKPKPISSGISEARSLFLFANGAEQAVVSDQAREKPKGVNSIPRLLITLSVTLLIILIILLAFPLSESFQRLANAIDPPPH